MLKLGRVTKFRMLFLVLVFVFNFNVFKFSVAILEKGLFLSFLSLLYEYGAPLGDPLGHRSSAVKMVVITIVITIKQTQTNFLFS